MFRARLRLFLILLVVVPVVLLCSFSCSSKVEAPASEVEKILNKTPDEVLFLVASSGGDNLKPSFSQTSIGRIWNDPGVQSFYHSIKEELLSKIKAEIGDSNDYETFETVRDLVKLILRRPIIIGAANKNVEEEVPVYGFAILDAGTYKAEIISYLVKLEALAGDGEIIEVKVGSYTMHGPKDTDAISVYWGWIGDYLVLAINENEGLALKYLEGGNDRSAPDYLSKVPNSGEGFVVYADYEKYFSFFESIVLKEGGGKEYDLFKAVVGELGIDKIGFGVARAGFSGSNLVVNKYVQMPSADTGFPTNFKPVELSMLDMVDRRAMSAAVVNCDIAGIYDKIFRIIKIVSPNEAYPEITKGIDELESGAKFKIRDGLLESLSGPMVFFTLTAGAVVEAPSGGSVLIAKLKDKSLFEKTMLAIEEFAVAKSGGMLQVSSQVQDGRGQHTWAIMPLAMMKVMPTWTIVDDHVVIATSAALCNSAITQMASRTNSIRDTEGYKLSTVEMPKNPLLFGYTDSKVQFTQMMTAIQQFWPMMTMMASKEGVKLPFVLPELSHIANDMQPSCYYCWSDSEGYYAHYSGSGIEYSMGSVAGVSMGMAIVMPALGKVKEQSQRLISATNLKGIGSALIGYAIEHDEKYPDSLDVLVEQVDLAAKMLESPRKPKDFTEPSYIYIPGQSATSHSQNILVYENPEFCGKKINVLFNDGHVDLMQKSQFMEALKETCRREGLEMPKTEFESSEEK